MRVIFDRSSFHGERFHLLESSKLRRAVYENRIQVFHTPAFIEETISTYGSKRAGSEWERHLQFAVEVCNGGFFLPKERIWWDEVGRDKRHAAKRLYPSRQHKDLPSEAQVRVLLTTRAPQELERAWSKSARDREDTQRKKDAQKDLYAALRRGEIHPEDRASIQSQSFHEFMQEEFVASGRVLMKLVDAKRHVVLSTRWEKRPDRYPFFSAFLKGLLFAQYYAAAMSNMRIDRNAQVDYEQLAYLTWADLVVSDDERFFRGAFEAIWQREGKRLMNAAEFITHLNAPF